MTEELTQATESGYIDKKTAEALTRLSPGAFCLHKSWGFGTIAAWNLSAGQIVVDFVDKDKHPMQAAYAAESLTPLPKEHILVRKFTAPDALKELANEKPLDVIRAILTDHGNRATADQISSILQPEKPEIFSASEFKKWWEATKKLMRADGHFQSPTKKKDPFVLLDQAENAGRGLLDKYQSARHIKDQLAALDRIVKSPGEIGSETADLQALVSRIEENALKNRKLHPAASLESLIARDEILAKFPTLSAGPTAPTVAEILVSEESRLQSLFDALPATKHRKTLEAFEVAFGERWSDKALRLAQNATSRIGVEIYRLFEKAGKAEVFRSALAKWIAERSVSSETLIWLCKERGAAFKELFNPDLLACVFSALEGDMLAERRSSRLRDLLVDDHKLLGDFLAKARPDEVRDTMRKLLLTPVFDDLSKRSLLARIVKKYPETQSMITGESQEEKVETLTVSWASLEKRKADFEHLVNKEIPENTRDIAIAKEEGDLRENFGFKAAKEQQRVLQRRREEGERDLATARGTDFANPDTTQVSIGTTVRLETESGGSETFSILGAWDSAPELGIVSYKAAIGQALLGKKVGDQVVLPTDKGSHTVRILGIEPFTDIAVLSKINVFTKSATPTPESPEN